MRPVFQGKEDLRRQYRVKRRTIPLQRRAAAQSLFYKTAERLADEHRFVASYAGFGDELCTQALNKILAEQDKLLLPKVEDGRLVLYHVQDPQQQLAQNSWSIYEPIPALCQPALIDTVTCVLVPGLAFDQEKHRLGYGKGYYDRLLATLSQPATYGVGFREQLHELDLPRAPHDIALKELLLF